MSNVRDMRTKKRAASLVVLSLLVPLALGCSSQSKQTITASEVRTEVRISTASEEASRPWSSTYGPARPKLTQTLSLGSVDVPQRAKSEPGPAADEPPIVVVEVNTTVTQSTTVIAPRNGTPAARQKPAADQRPHVAAAPGATPPRVSAKPKPPRAKPDDEKKKAAPPPPQPTFVLAGTRPG